MLSETEEFELAESVRQCSDLDAARRLILPHLRFVIKLSRTYLGYGLAQADLIQEGNIGLMKAVKRFDARKGVRLVSFAVHWIRAEMHEFIIRNWRIVKIATTKAQRKLFFNLRKKAKQLNWFSESEAQSVAEELDVSVKEVRHMEARLNAYDQAFDSGSEDSDDNSPQKPANYLEDNRYNPAELLEAEDSSSYLSRNMMSALTQLDERSQTILRTRWLDEKKATLHELADKYQVSAERIRQIEQAAMGKLKRAITANN